MDRRHRRYEPAALTAAVTGGDVLPSLSPAIPTSVEAIVESAVGAAEAGASCVHLHARDPRDGRPSGSPELFARMAEGIRDRCDVVLSFSTGGAPGMTEAERVAGLEAGHPEIATFNLGTMNYETFPTRSRWPETNVAWERSVLEGSGEGVFVNTLNQMRRLADRCRALDIIPELEAYDLGHLSTARFLIDEGTLTPPVRVQLVLGVLGGAGNALEDLFTLVQAARRILGDDLGALGIAAVGYPMELRHCAVGLSLGLDCRVGLEDNLRITRDRYAESNAELVTAATRLAELVGRPIASPAQLRASLGAGEEGRT
jgi:uncharacterized protein (DUF849 family)